MIRRFASLFKRQEEVKKEVKTQTTLLETKVECAIDDEVVECKEMNDTSYVGVPAPIYLKDDDWFGPAAISDENKDYMEREHEAFKEEAHKFYGTKETKESENIHQELYELATASQNTTIHLNPVDPVGGSENFQEGPGGWTSGNGWSQFYE